MASTVFQVHAAGVREVSVAASTLAALRADALEMIVFSVGNGEAILLRRKQHGILVDGGAELKPENADLGRALAGWLHEHHVKLRALVASHPHTDHLNAVATMLDEGGSKILAGGAEFYDNGEEYPSGLTKTLLETLDQKKSTIDRVRMDGSDRRLKLGSDVRLLLFTDGRSKPKPVYKSIWMAVRFRAARFLFTGDSYEDYESELVPDVPRAPARRVERVARPAPARPGGAPAGGADAAQAAASLLGPRPAAAGAAEPSRRAHPARLRPGHAR